MSSFDPVTLAVVANRLDSIVREMENTLLRTGRSAVLNMARDFSCALITADTRLLTSAEGLPVHVIGMEFLAEAVTDLHDDLTKGDAFLHNDPYLGNTHPADHVILVPVFAAGRHVFTAAAKAHQADCGNAQPTTYMPYARDVYEEGSLVFPAVRVQRDYRDIDDVLRMCRRRIRVPDRWYGDYLAMLGAAGIGDARLEELCARYGFDTLERFVEEWFDYSERRIAHVIAGMPEGTIVGHGVYDPFGPAPEGIPITVKITVDPDAGMIEADLTDNIDCLPAGVNESRTDWRKNDDPYVNQKFLGSQGGPAGPEHDGWLTYGNAVTNGLMFRDSIEAYEQRYPIRIHEIGIRTDSEGAGRRRGAPGTRVTFGPKHDPMTAAYVTDGYHHPPRGTLGGGEAAPSVAFKVGRDGSEAELEPIAQVVLEPGELLGHALSGGGGYGKAFEREPERVREDVLARFVSFERAREVYGVAFANDVLDDSLAIDHEATARPRSGS